MMNRSRPMEFPLSAPNSARLELTRSFQRFKLPILLTVAHLPLGVLLYNSSQLAFLHPAIVFLFGLGRACRRQETLERVTMVVAYIIGVEVLWRMSGVAIFWEGGKYAAAAIMFAALAARGKWTMPVLPLLYIMFLLPACLLTLYKNDFVYAKSLLSSNMSGPLLLFVGCWFFSHAAFSWEQIKNIFFAAIIPLSSVAVTTLFYTVTNPDIQFNTESNHATSGGFGPNQVSAMLGLGVFLCISAYLLFKNRLADNLYLGFFAVLFTAQSVMTFSRGGMYNAVGAALVVAFFQMRNPAHSVKRLVPVACAALFFLLLIFPYLNDFTGGNLEARFKESDPTNRGSIVEADFEIFANNPIFGVGVGESYAEYVKILNQETSTHTELSRLLSEHGLFGALALACLALMFLRNLQRQSSSAGKALVGGLFVWSMLFMLNAGMRLAAPAFILGLTFLTVPPLARKAGRDFQNGSHRPRLPQRLWNPKSY